MRNAAPEGGHLAVEQAISAQFGGVFSSFTRLRRRRNELDDPVGPEDFADNAEAAAAVLTSTEIVDNAERILDQGVLTRF
ncbi:MAG: hypothetical protein M3423_06030 [Actinomycetota bacterium]|nr:hypothetical protein [Actinomycetota bacterium]